MLSWMSWIGIRAIMPQYPNRIAAQKPQRTRTGKRMKSSPVAVYAKAMRLSTPSIRVLSSRCRKSSDAVASPPPGGTNGVPWNPPE